MISNNNTVPPSAAPSPDDQQTKGNPAVFPSPSTQTGVRNACPKSPKPELVVATETLHSQNAPEISVLHRKTETSNETRSYLLTDSVTETVTSTPERHAQGSTLAWFKSQQGDLIETTEFSERLLDRQGQFVQKALEVLDHSGDQRPDTCSHLHDWIQQFHDYHRKITGMTIETKANVFAEAQFDFYHQLHKSPDLAEEHKSGFEFLLGLERFLIAVELTLQFALFLRDSCELKAFQDVNLEAMEDQVNSEPFFFKRLTRASEVSEIAIDLITKVFSPENPPQSYWQAAKSFYAENPVLEQLAKALISIHYEPEDAGYLGMAQHLHWNGLGGNGKYLTHEKLKGLQNQAFDYHGTEKTGLLHQHFTRRLDIFGRELAELRAYTTHATTNALKDRGNNGEPICIYDLCTGPKYGAVADTVTALQAQGKKVALTLSDVDGSNLKALIDKRNEAADGLIEHVRYEDLNLPLEAPESELNKFDLVSAALGLHQLPAERQRESIQYFTRVAKPGGFISIPHVNERAHAQLMLIPANIVDRESYVSDEILFNFEELATSNCRSGHLKVPYPLRGVTIHRPENTDKENLYSYTMYVVVEVTEENLSELQTLWNNGQHDKANALINRSTNTNIDKLEQHIKGEGIHLPTPP